MPTNVVPFRGPTTKDAGDEASSIKFRHGAQAALVVIVADGQYHIGSSSMSPIQMRDLACNLINASYVQQQRINSQLP